MGTVLLSRFVEQRNPPAVSSEGDDRISETCSKNG